MEGIQLELFRSFTTADERKDVHTSACAMLRDYFEQMDIESIRLMLSETESLSDVPTPQYIDLLSRIFLYMRMANNTVLESAEGLCTRCHPNVAGFIFRGMHFPLHFSLLFHVHEDKVVDIHECELMHRQFRELDFSLKLQISESTFLSPEGF